MAYTYITSSGAASAATGSGNTQAVTLGAAVSVGDLITVGEYLRSGDGVNPTAPTDSLGNTYTQLGTTYDEATNLGKMFAIFYSVVTFAGTPVITGHYDGAAFARAVHAQAHTGGTAASPADSVSKTGTAASGTAITSANLVPTQDGDVLVAIADSNAEVPAGANGWTVTSSQTVTAQSIFGYKIQTTATTEAASFSTGASGAWAVLAGSLKSGAVAGSTAEEGVVSHPQPSSPIGRPAIGGLF